MRSWRYVESSDDGEVWLSNLASVSGCIEYVARSPRRETRRMMVATRAWIDSQLNASDVTPHRRWAILPRVLVVPEGSQADIEEAIDRAVSMGALDPYSEQVSLE